MKAMILSAGLGTRLRPLTLIRPKPLVPIFNQPLILLLLSTLAQAGVSRVMANTHHLADRLEAFAAVTDLPLPLTLRYEPEILLTGGGLKNTADFWDDAPFVVINGDILFDFDLTGLIKAHVANGSLVTMALHDHARYNNVLVNDQQRVVGIRGRNFAPGKRLLAYTGIQVINPELLDFLPSGPSDFIDTYISLIASGSGLSAYVISGHYWSDIGSPGDYLQVHRDIMAGKVTGQMPPNGRVVIGQGSHLSDQAITKGLVSLGENVEVGAGCILEDVVIWDNVTVKPGARLERAIVADGVTVTADLVDAAVA
ncbi:MAG: NDP-sugar synthase [Deltaproteobacteria bacterium]|nr:NDP-sugar synthase [Deltaproteobacteria bacterium]